MRVLVCGSRTWRDEGPIFTALEALPTDTVIVHGAAKGADSLAARAAECIGQKTEAYPADWERFGKRAGFIRNGEMIESGIDEVIAFKDKPVSVGTDMTIKLAHKRGIPVQVFSSYET